MASDVVSMPFSDHSGAGGLLASTGGPGEAAEEGGVPGKEVDVMALQARREGY